MGYRLGPSPLSNSFECMSTPFAWTHKHVVSSLAWMIAWALTLAHFAWALPLHELTITWAPPLHGWLHKYSHLSTHTHVSPSFVLHPIYGRSMWASSRESKVILLFGLHVGIFVWAMIPLEEKLPNISYRTFLFEVGPTWVSPSLSISDMTEPLRWVA